MKRHHLIFPRNGLEITFFFTGMSRKQSFLSAPPPTHTHRNEPETTVSDVLTRIDMKRHILIFSRESLAYVSCNDF